MHWLNKVISASPPTVNNELNCVRQLATDRTIVAQPVAATSADMQISVTYVAANLRTIRHFVLRRSVIWLALVCIVVAAVSRGYRGEYHRSISFIVCRPNMSLTNRQSWRTHGVWASSCQLLIMLGCQFACIVTESTNIARWGAQQNILVSLGDKYCWPFKVVGDLPPQYIGGRRQLSEELRKREKKISSGLRQWLNGHLKLRDAEQTTYNCWLLQLFRGSQWLGRSLDPKLRVRMTLGYFMRSRLK